MNPQTAAIALGSNLSSSFGSREQTLRAAIVRIAALGRIVACSSFFDTAPVGDIHQPRFLNSALLLETTLSPHSLLEALLSIERAMGRQREGAPSKGPRIIDLDLLWFEEEVITSPELTLPHPALPDRLFVLQPLAEIAPAWVHPVLRLSVSEMLARLTRSMEALPAYAAASDASSRPDPRPMAEQKPSLGALPTEARNPRSEHLDQLSTSEMLAVINDEDATLAAAVRLQIPNIALAVDSIAASFRAGGRLFYVGAGTSGRLGVLDASECPPTFSVEPGRFVGLIAGGDSALRLSSESSEDSREEGARDLAAHHLTPHDSVLGIAASGRTPYVLGALEHASSAGALTVALTCAGRPAAQAGSSALSPMAEAATLAMELATGPEVLTGSTRMKAGTATKMVLNMISTAVMIRTGAVFGNLMVNVQPTNQKLLDRAERIIASATGCSPAEAAALMREAGSVKRAILMHRLALSPERAHEALQSSSGVLRAALDAAEDPTS